jgi:hypothetical protein
VLSYARQAFTKSAQYAGFVDGTTGRFIKPGNTADGPAREEEVKPEREPEKEKRTGGGNGGGGLDDLHPFIVDLLRTIPPAHIGASIFGLIYEGSRWPR